MKGAGVLHNINKDKGDESLPLLVSEIFKERQIILKPFRNSKYLISCLLWWHKTLPGAIWSQAYSEPLQISKRECFCVNNLQIKVVNWIRKSTPSQMFERVLNTPLLKAGVRCTKRTFNTAAWNVNLRDMHLEIIQWY